MRGDFSTASSSRWIPPIDMPTEHTKALQHRNSILKGPSMTHQGLGSSLAVWDEQLATHGAKLIQLRRKP